MTEVLGALMFPVVVMMAGFFVLHGLIRASIGAVEAIRQVT